MTETEATLRSICRFIDLPWDAAMLRYYERSEERLQELDHDLPTPDGRGTVPVKERRAMHGLTSKPPQGNRAGRWRQEMSSEERRRFEKIAGSTLASLGYEID